MVLMEHRIIKQLRDIDWQHLVNRKETPLLKSITDSSEVHFKQAAILPWTAHYRFRDGEGNIWYSSANLDELRAIFYRDGAKALKHFRKRMLKVVSEFDKYARTIGTRNLSAVSQRELLALTKKYFRYALFAHCFLTATAVADGVISKMIKEMLPLSTEDLKNKYLAQLAFIEKENSHVKEQRDFYKLVTAYARAKNDRLIDKHLKKYAWIGSRGYWWDRAWTKNMLKDRIKDYLISGENPKKELEHLNLVRAKQKQKNLAALRKLKIKTGSKLYQLILLAREYAFLRTWRTDVMYGAGYHARNLFEEIANRGKRPLVDLEYLVWKEVIQCAATAKFPITRKELSNRKRYFANFFNRGQYTILSGRTWKKRIDKIFGAKRLKTESVTGNSAYRGLVKGKVTKVFSGLDLNKVKKGDVLVAVMTFPNFVPAMEKASAFVTDEGGILCHAAIVSREMKKPCVIATKVATQVFKDGDFVEVDANRGIVKILKRA